MGRKKLALVKCFPHSYVKEEDGLLGYMPGPGAARDSYRLATVSCRKLEKLCLAPSEQIEAGTPRHQLWRGLPPAARARAGWTEDGKTDRVFIAEVLWFCVTAVEKKIHRLDRWDIRGHGSMESCQCAEVMTVAAALTAPTAHSGWGDAAPRHARLPDARQLHRRGLAGGVRTPRAGDAPGRRR